MSKRSRIRRSKHANLSQTVSIKDEGDLVELMARFDPPFLLILDNVQDPHNLGACLRVADAAGVHAVIAPKDRSATLTPTVRHIASGAAEHIPFIQVTNLARTLRYLKDNRVRVVGASNDAEQSLYSLDLSGPLAIVMGSEGDGLRQLTRQTCDYLVSIPMSGAVSCLNASVAAGVCLFEALRQRQASASGPSEIPKPRRLSLKPTTK